MGSTHTPEHHYDYPKMDGKKVTFSGHTLPHSSADWG